MEFDNKKAETNIKSALIAPEKKNIESLKSNIGGNNIRCID